VLKLANLALASPGHESNVRFKLIAARERTFRIPPIRTVISGSTGFHVTHAPAGQFGRRGGAIGQSGFDPAARERRPWNAGRTVGAKRALKAQQVWTMRFWLDREGRLRDRALFDLAIDSKLRGYDVVQIRISDLVSGGRVRTRATVVQQKTGLPVQFELLESARTSIQAWLERRGGTLDDYSSRAGTTTLIISALDSSGGSSASGSLVPGCDERTTAHIHCGEQRPR
jgi:hypothetical protein